MTVKEYNNCTRQWADDVMRFAVRLCADRAECEDAVQDAMTALWENRERVTNDKGKNYLLGVTYRRLMMHFRRQKSNRNHIRADQEPQQEPDMGFDLKEAIEHSLATLPEVQRAILQLRDVEGYSYSEIGESLKISDDKVQVYLFRARVAMRKELIKMGYDEYKQ